MTTATEGQTVLEQQTAGGRTARYVVRDDTNDSALVRGIVGGAEYPFDRLRSLTGWAVDIGAHIGIVSIALALDNPDLRIVAVEALSENVEILRRNIAENGLIGRVFPVNAAAGTDEPTEIGWGYQFVPDETDEANRQGGYVQMSRFIGNIYSPREGMVSQMRTVPGVSLTALLADFGIDRVALLKLDCESCEWTVMRSPAVSRCERIIGEWHGEPGLAGLRVLLATTHDVVQLDDNPTNGIFEAVLR